MLQYNLKFAEHLDEEKFDELIAYLREEAASGAEKQSVAEKIAAYAKQS